MSKVKINSIQAQFIDELSSVLLPWGMPVAVGRLYGFLLLQEEPVSLDVMCDVLEIAKSTASVAARELERANLVTRHSVRGSKRVLYSVSSGNTSIMQDKVVMLGQVADLLKKQNKAATNTTAANRLQGLANYCLAMQSVLVKAIQDLDTDWNSAPTESAHDDCQS